MRFSLEPGQETVWGFNVRRDTVSTAEVDRWVATPRGANGFVSRFGHLRFPTAPAPPRKLEFQPFVLGREEHTTAVGFDQGLSGGVDMRMGLGTSATLSATVNPDFGQVEQDPAVLNLSVFETFFPEKTPVLYRRQPHVRPAVRLDADVPFAPHRPAPRTVYLARGRPIASGGGHKPRRATEVRRHHGKRLDVDDEVGRFDPAREPAGECGAFDEAAERLSRPRIKRAHARFERSDGWTKRNRQQNDTQISHQLTCKHRVDTRISPRPSAVWRSFSCALLKYYCCRGRQVSGRVLRWTGRAMESSMRKMVRARRDRFNT